MKTYEIEHQVTIYENKNQVTEEQQMYIQEVL